MMLWTKSGEDLCLVRIYQQMLKLYRRSKARGLRQKKEDAGLQVHTTCLEGKAL